MGEKLDIKSVGIRCGETPEGERIMQKGEVARKRLWSERYPRLYTAILGGLLIGGVLFCVLSGVKQRLGLLAWGSLFITVGVIISILNIVSKRVLKKYGH